MVWKKIIGVAAVLTALMSLNYLHILVPEAIANILGTNVTTNLLTIVFILATASSPFLISREQKKSDLVKLKLEHVYSPLYYMLFQARQRAIQLQQSDNAYTLSYADIDEIERILRDNAHLISQDMINLWLQRNQGAIFTQWNRQQGSTGLFDVVTGLTCSLSDFYNTVNSEFLSLRGSVTS